MNEQFPLALPEETILAGRYVVKEVLGQGGFGITYMAVDNTTYRKVAVKEFFPDTLATRTMNQTEVISYTGERGESFQYGKTCFLKEAETLAELIGLPGIVKIQSYFEENGTAYFVMDFIEGTRFDDYIKDHGGKLTYEEAEKILVPVMAALSSVHEKGIIHRDVTPDNILLMDDGSVHLLDFGAARYSLGDKSRSLDVVLKHGYAPKEQYTRHGKQGPFTDVYSLAACFYFALTGERPPDSIDRIDEDELIPPSKLGVDISEKKEAVLLKALEVQSANRFQSMDDFRCSLLDLKPLNQGKVVERIFTASGGGKNNNTENNNTESIPEASSETKKKKWLVPVLIGAGVMAFTAVFLFLAGAFTGGSPFFKDRLNSSFDPVFANNAIGNGEANFYEDEIWFWEPCNDLATRNADYPVETLRAVYQSKKKLFSICPLQDKVYFIEDCTIKVLDKATENVSDVEDLSSFIATSMVANEDGCFFATDDLKLHYYSFRSGLRKKAPTLATSTSYALCGNTVYYVPENGDRILCTSVSGFGKQFNKPKKLYENSEYSSIPLIAREADRLYFVACSMNGKSRMEVLFLNEAGDEMTSGTYTAWDSRKWKVINACEDKVYFIREDEEFRNAVFEVTVSPDGNWIEWSNFFSSYPFYGGRMNGFNVFPRNMLWYCNGLDEKGRNMNAEANYVGIGNISNLDFVIFY